MLRNRKQQPGSPRAALGSTRAQPARGAPRQPRRGRPYLLVQPQELAVAHPTVQHPVHVDVVGLRGETPLTSQHPSPARGTRATPRSPRTAQCCPQDPATGGTCTPSPPLPSAKLSICPRKHRDPPGPLACPVPGWAGLREPRLPCRHQARLQPARGLAAAAQHTAPQHSLVRRGPLQPWGGSPTYPRLPTDTHDSSPSSGRSCCQQPRAMWGWIKYSGLAQVSTIMC